MRLDVISLVPEAFRALEGLGVIGRALRAGIAELHLHNPRDFASDRYRKVDDLPYGGGAGMVLKPEPLFAAYEAIPVLPRRRVLLLTPQGTPLRQSLLRRWASEHEQLVLLCGHYEGFDERIRSLAEEEISLGDFVLTGGELPAMVIINGVVRLLPGTVGSAASLEQESHSDLLLEHPHYTRPASFRGLEVPAVLRSGDHGAIARWRLEQQQQRTRERRPDLYARWCERQGQGTAPLEAGPGERQEAIPDGIGCAPQAGLRPVEPRDRIPAGSGSAHPDDAGAKQSQEAIPDGIGRALQAGPRREPQQREIPGDPGRARRVEAGPEAAPSPPPTAAADHQSSAAAAEAAPPPSLPIPAGPPMPPPQTGAPLQPAAFPMQLRIGNGYDIHRLVAGRPLILGGQRLEHPEGLGLDGHSDADVLVHALMDALLGALSLGDIGRYFPPEDPRWKDADSLQLLERVRQLIEERGWQVVNVDAVVVAERPKLRPHIEAMRSAIAERLGIEPDQVGVKATTNERLGPTGREEGIACHAVALLQRPGNGGDPGPVASAVPVGADGC